MADLALRIARILGDEEDASRLFLFLRRLTIRTGADSWSAPPLPHQSEGEFPA